LLQQSNEELSEQKDSNKTLEKKVKLLEGKLGDKKIKNKALKAELKGLKDRTDAEISQLEKLL
jgi:molecular chaperone GrpE (heat shock protein)